MSCQCFHIMAIMNDPRAYIFNAYRGVVWAKQTVNTRGVLTWKWMDFFWCENTHVSSQVHETTRLNAAPAVVKTRVEHPTSATCPPQNLFAYRTSTRSKSGNLHSQPVSYIQVSGNKTKDLYSSNIICHRYQKRSILYFHHSNYINSR